MNTTNSTNVIKEEKPPIRKCDVCGKKTVATFMECSMTNELNLKPVLYKPYKFGKKYRLCFPCFYKAMGVKP